jgi:hypothetical protein
MNWSSALTVALAGVLLGASARGQVVDFENDPPGEPPAGFAIAQTGPGEAPRWRVEQDASAPSGQHVLVQRSADQTRARFPLAVHAGSSLADGTIRVRFKTLSGSVDQAAGIVWRYRDPDNYYVVRANALEGNVVLYKVEAGKRSDLDPIDSGLFAYGKEASVRAGAWQELQVQVKGDFFQVHLDGVHLFDVRDATFTGAGRVGLWTKANSVTAFDDLAIGMPDEQGEQR